jgi:MoaE-MoaD fusion protein
MSDAQPHSDDHFALTRTQIHAESWVEKVRTPGDGAVVTFAGCVRNHSLGRRTLHLEYEGYEPMALLKMREIGQQLHNMFAIDRIAIVHRLGHLEIGETSVFIAVSAAHRAPAFEACRLAIDTLKRTVPIWKKEFFEDGAIWAEGEVPQVPGAASAVESAS